MFSFKNKNIIVNMMSNSLFDLPAPKNISFLWNFGSLLGLCLINQIISGLFISMHFTPHSKFAFESVVNMMLDNNYSWLMQMAHANGASMFFFCLFIHIGRGMYYQSFKSQINTWMIGVILFFLSMATAFMGYVLPWGQMSFWGATVITNLLATIPYLGNDLVIWLWGGFSVDNPTLNRFFVIHFILPFIILMFTIIHLLMLHQNGSNNPLGLNSNMAKISFFPYFIYKDLLSVIILYFMFIYLISSNPYLLGDPDNFTPANPLSTPEHIQPEWYFLFAYAILRSIPNKLGGVIALVMSIMILFIMPFLSKNNFQGHQFYFMNQFIFWFLFTMVILLTWIGMSPMETPFIQISQILTILYFSYFFLNQLMMNFWNNLIN